MEEVKRVRYFDHEFLDAADFEVEQDYHRSMRHRHIRYFHTWGLARFGLEVKKAENQETGEETKVAVYPGTALDNEGREIVLPESRILDFDQPRFKVNTSYYVTIQWHEQQCQPRQDNEHKRWVEDPHIDAIEDMPERPDMELVLAKVELREKDKTIKSIDDSMRRYAAHEVGDKTVTSVKIVEADGKSGQDINRGDGIKTDHIQDDAITSAKIKEAEPGTTDQDTSQGYGIKTGHIQDLAVTVAKIAESTINESKFDSSTRKKLVTKGDSHNHSGQEGDTTAKIKHTDLNMEGKINPHGIGMSNLVDLKAGDNIDTNHKRITHLAGPNNDDDAANKGYVDTKNNETRVYVDTKDGGLRSYVDEKDAENREYVDSKNNETRVYVDTKDGGIRSYVDVKDAENRKYADGKYNDNRVHIDNRYSTIDSYIKTHDHTGDHGKQIKHSSLDISGETNPHNVKMSQLKDFNARGERIKNLAQPDSSNDAATRGYVEGYVSKITNILHGDKQVNASYGCTASVFYSQVNASGGSNANGFSKATGQYSQVNASYASTASETRSQVNASATSEASGWRSQVNASETCTAETSNTQVNASTLSKALHGSSQVNASIRVATGGSFTMCGGYYHTGDASSASRKWELNSQEGSLTLYNKVINSFLDYGEYFENLKKGVIDIGMLIALEGAKVRPAKKDEEFIGVVSGTAAIVLGDSPFCWQGRYLKDEWGRNVYEEIKDPDWQPKAVHDEKWKPKKGETEEDRPIIPIETEEDRPTIRVQKENPDYDPKREQKPRSERPEEWTLVGLLGQVYVRCDGTVKPGDFVKCKGNGIGTKSAEKTRLRAMKVTKEYDGKYSIVYCLLI